MRIGIATDHGGFVLKEDLVAQLRTAGYEIIDFGANKLNPDDDYPDFVVPLGRAVAAGQIERGVAICGSGVRASVCATPCCMGRAQCARIADPCNICGRPLQGKGKHQECRDA
jgi:RpiB/LacA/LacB family sugar-phosphate isomerase